MMINYILPGAWQLTEEVQTSIYAINVPTAWRQIARTLTERRSRTGYRNIPVRSLDSIVSMTFPQIICTNRRSWRGEPVPWIYATNQADIAELPFLVRGWFLEEFGWCLGVNEVEAALSNLQNENWHWSAQVYSPTDEEICWQAIPDYLAQQLHGSTITFGINRQHLLKFYRVNRFENGAELMSFPPSDIPMGKGKVSVSFVIRLRLQTVPWRKEPLIYHALSLRRWITLPLIQGEDGEFRYRGVTAYVGDTRRWLDGAEQPFSFVTLRMKRGEEEPYWHPRAVTELLKDAGEIPEPRELALNPAYNWHQFNPSTRTVQAAIPVSDRLRKHPCLPGVSPLDLARLDQAIAVCLPIERVGEGVRVPLAKHRRSVQPSDKNKLMLHPETASPAASKILRSQPTVLILWETEAIRDALIGELCRLLALSPTSESNIYAGEYGSIQILAQDVGILGEVLDVGGFSTPVKTRQQRRIELLEERSQQIANSVPQVEGLKGALVEIVKPPNVPEADPKLAWRVGLAQTGYVNQHLHALKKVDEDTSRNAERTRVANKERVKRAVADLLRQWGILPDSLIEPEIDGVESSTWLTCLSILRRTRRTTVQGVPHTAAIMLRVNPRSGEVQATTPKLWGSQRWVSYPDVLQHLISERWEPGSWFEESDDESREEKALLTKFVAQSLQDCLNTPIADSKNPYVLFMAEAHNTRSKLGWLHNSNLLKLPVGNLPDELKLHIPKQEERDRLWIVRLRTADDMEVPACIAKNSEGSRTSGVFEWQSGCDESERQLYLSISRLPSSAKFVLRKSESRLDSAKRPAGQVRPLEIALIHHRGISAEQLAQFIHSLREQWLYFAGTVALPFPFPFGIKAKEYALSVRDNVENIETIEEAQLQDEQ